MTFLKIDIKAGSRLQDTTKPYRGLSIAEDYREGKREMMLNNTGH